MASLYQRAKQQVSLFIQPARESVQEQASAVTGTDYSRPVAPVSDTSGFVSSTTPTSHPSYSGGGGGGGGGDDSVGEPAPLPSDPRWADFEIALGEEVQKGGGGLTKSEIEDVRSRIFKPPVTTPTQLGLTGGTGGSVIPYTPSKAIVEEFKPTDFQRAKDWMARTPSPQERLGKFLGGTKPVKSFYSFVSKKELKRIEKDKELIRKYKSGKNLTDWERNKLTIMGVIPKTPHKQRLGWAGYYLKGVGAVVDPAIEKLPEGKLKRALSKPAPDWAIVLLDYYLKASFFSPAIATGTAGQKSKQRVLSDREKLKIYNQQFNAVSNKISYDKVYARNKYVETVKQFGRNSKETKFIEKLYKDVLGSKNAKVLFKDALQQEGLFEKSIFSSGVQPKTSFPKSTFGGFEVQPPQVHIMKNIGEVIAGTQAITRTLDLTKQQAKETQRLNEALGIVQFSKSGLVQKQVQKSDLVQRQVQQQFPKMAQPQLTKFAQPQPQKISNILVSNFPTKQRTPPKSTPPFLLLPYLPRITKAERRRRRIEELKIRRQQRAYQSSVGAFVLGIRYKKFPKRKVFSGLGLRPMLPRKRKLKKKARPRKARVQRKQQRRNNYITEKKLIKIFS